MELRGESGWVEIPTFTIQVTVTNKKWRLYLIRNNMDRVVSAVPKGDTMLGARAINNTIRIINMKG